MELFRAFIILIFTYVVASEVLFLTVRRFLGAARPVSDRRLFVLTRGGGPVLISALLYVLLLLFPGQPAALYPVIILVFFGLLLFYSRTEIAALKSTYVELLGELGRLFSRERSNPLSLIVTVFLIFSLVFGIAFPIVEHDALVATLEGRLIYRDLGLDGYLAVQQPDEATGYFRGGFRTPSLQLVHAWFTFTAGPTYADPLTRTISPIYAIFCMLLLGFCVYRHFGTRSTRWAVFLLITTPLFFYMSYNNGWDTIRLYLTFLSLVWTADLIDCPHPSIARMAAVSGVILGLGLFTHLLVAPALLAASLALLFLAHWPWPKRIITVVVLSTTALLVGAQYQYFLNPAVRNQMLRSIDRRFVNQFAALVKPLLPFKLPSPASVAVAKRDPATKPKAPPRAVPTVSAQKPKYGTDRREDELPEWVRDREQRLAPPRRPPKPAAKTIATPEPTRKEESLPRAADGYQDYLSLRGQGGPPIRQLIFGQLQIFTGIEYFGVLFYLAAMGFILWLRQPQKTTLGKLFIIAGVLYFIVVFSGIRKVSWSNPRYIGSLMMIGAYFAAPLLTRLEELIALGRDRLRGLMIAGLILFLIFPVLLVTSIRGAKVEITNDGTFYQDFRSFRWLDTAINNPRDALGILWNDYLGIANTLRYLAADESTKLKHSHDYFAAIQYLNQHSGPESQALLFRDARYFYYAQRKGFSWYHPRIFRKLRRAKSTEELHAFLESCSITHVLIDSYSKVKSAYRETKTDELLRNAELAELVYEFGIAQVYRLRKVAESPRRPNPQKPADK